ncbi:MAG: hypothetical protein ACYCZB_14140 [Acidiphilium sp.]
MIHSSADALWSALTNLIETKIPDHMQALAQRIAGRRIPRNFVGDPIADAYGVPVAKICWVRDRIDAIEKAMRPINTLRASSAAVDQIIELYTIASDAASASMEGISPSKPSRRPCDFCWRTASGTPSDKYDRWMVNYTCTKHAPAGEKRLTNSIRADAMRRAKLVAEPVRVKEIEGSDRPPRPWLFYWRELLRDLQAKRQREINEALMARPFEYDPLKFDDAMRQALELDHVASTAITKTYPVDPRLDASGLTLNNNPHWWAHPSQVLGRHAAVLEINGRASKNRKRRTWRPEVDEDESALENQAKMEHAVRLAAKGKSPRVAARESGLGEKHFMSVYRRVKAQESTRSAA